MIVNWYWEAIVHHELFQKKREESNTDAKKFKCTASEALSLVAVLAVFFASFIVKRLVTALTPFLDVYAALAKVCDLFYQTSRHSVQPKDLLKAVEDFLQVFTAVYGVECMTPKFHWLLHFWKYLCSDRFGRLVSCFVHERIKPMRTHTHTSTQQIGRAHV